ncbi:hypothetical protein Hanom_Chr12g01153691 [Helianthus anomalus]
MYYGNLLYLSQNRGDLYLYIGMRIEGKDHGSYYRLSASYMVSELLVSIL